MTFRQNSGGKMKEVFDRGYLDYCDGLKNPYGYLSDKWLMWMEGWMEAYKDDSLSTDEILEDHWD